MKTSLKMLGLLVLFILAFSMTIRDRPLFSYVYDLISPATKSAQIATEGFLKISLSSTQTYSKKLFDNSVPHLNHPVKSNFFASQNVEIEHPAERITDEEKSQLNELIKNH
jgi:hypothetical protein